MMRKPAPVEIQAERAQAAKDYNDDVQAIRDRTAKLRAERLARAAAEPPKVAKPKPEPKASKAKASAAKSASD